MSEPAAAAPAGRQIFQLVRADDQVDLSVELVDLTVEKSGATYRIVSAVGGYLIVLLPPQHVLETVRTTQAEIDRGQVPVFGWQTKLVFDVPPGGAPIPFTAEGILGALPGLRLVTKDVGMAKPAPAPAPRVPAAQLVLAAAAGRAAADPTARQDQGQGQGQGQSQGQAATLTERARQAAARVPAAPPATEDQAARTPATPPETETATPPATEKASPPATAAAAAVLKAVTQLALPSRLELTPRGGATRFAHAAAPVARDGRVELWHTRLALARADGRLVEPPAELIALETDELRPENPPPGSEAALWRQRVGDARLAGPGGLIAANRQAVVTQSGSRPLEADQLLLSALGAWTDLHGDWRDDDPVTSYRHRLAMGRDVAIRVAGVGRLHPLGHRAVLVTATARTLPQDNGQVAGLTTTSFISVQERTRTYADNERSWPWGSVTVLTRTTPAGKATGFVGSSVMLTTEDGVPIQFRCLGVDRGGRTATFELPLVFVPDGFGDLGPVASTYNSREKERTVELRGQVLSVAPARPEAPDAADVVADQVVLRMASSQTGSGTRVVASTDRIVGALPALQRFAPGTGAQVLRYAGEYLTSGFDATKNAGEVLLTLAGTAPPVSLAGGAVTGGLVDPRFPLTTLSRLVGPVGGPAARLAAGKVKAGELLAELLDDVTLFGVFPLADLIGDLDLDVATDVPRMVTHAVEGISLPRLHWTVPLFQGSQNGDVPARKDVDAGPVGGTLRAGRTGPAQLVLDVTTELVQPVDPAHPVMHTTTTCRVENVELSLRFEGAELVTVPLRHLTLTSRDGSKPDLDAKLGGLEFHGLLAFLRTLAGLVPADGFADPPALDVRADGIRSSFSVPVPAVGAGAFSLENITFSAALDIWFAKPPELSLDFSSRDNRFRVAVLGLGGGGFFGLGLSTRGLERLEGVLEFGASVSVHLGIAHGSVSVMGGVYLGYDRDTGATIEGYVEVRGEVDVLGLIEVGVTLLVALAYELKTGRLTGRAELEVHVRVLFLKKTVRVPFEYEFAGADSSPRALAAAAAPAPAGVPGFLDQMAPADWPAGRPRPWDTYCLAFA